MLLSGMFSLSVHKGKKGLSNGRKTLHDSVKLFCTTGITYYTAINSVINVVVQLLLSVKPRRDECIMNTFLPT